jgi:hypothetical protein
MNHTTVFAARFLIADNSRIVLFPLVSTRGLVICFVGVIAWLTFGALIAIAIAWFGISHHLFCGFFFLTEFDDLSQCVVARNEALIHHFRTNCDVMDESYVVEEHPHICGY